MAAGKIADRTGILIRRTGGHLLPALIIAGFFIIWQIGARLLASPLLPPFSDVLINLFTTPGFSRHLFHSLGRMSAGLALAAAAGFPLGIISGLNKKGGRAISLPAYLLHPVPKTVFIPVILLFAGIGEFSKILLVFLSLVFHLILNTRDSVRLIPEEYFTSIHAAGGGKREAVRWVVIPAAMPALFSTLRISLGIAAAVLFFAEYFGTDTGMGFFIMDARTRVNFTDLYSGILGLSLVMLALFRLLNWSERKICGWSRPYVRSASQSILSAQTAESP